MDFSTLDKILETAGTACEAAEAHGTLSGLLCFDATDAQQRWLASLEGDTADEVEFSAAELGVLRKTVAETASQLSESGFAFQPCLPPDATSLDVRADALALWCQGFLHGLALSGVGDPAKLPGDAPEVVSDFGELTRTAVGPDPGDDDEVAFAELVEFVRIGVQLVYEELRAASAGQTLH